MAKAATQTRPATKNIKKDLTLAQRTEQRLAEENRWQMFDAETKYVASNMQKCVKNLGDIIFPYNEYNSNIYQEAIVNSLTETISPEVGIKDFWKNMGKDGCKTVKIEEGHMNFYDAKNKKMDLTKYTQPIVFYATSNLYEQREIERQKRIIEAKKQLEELMAEINKKQK